MLLDTASLYFRAFFGIPISMRAPDGTPNNAIRGMLDFVGYLVGKYEPAKLVACLDADWRPQFRVDLLPSYKGHRVDMYDAPPGGESTDAPPDLDVQVPIILAALDALGVASLGVPGFEADDVIGTLAATGEHIDVVTGDRDLFQAVDDNRDVRVFYTARGVGKIQVIDEAEVLERYGVRADQYADFATMRGDPSDGLPGVPGVGDKTAASLLRAYGDLPGIRAAAEDVRSQMPMAQRRKIIAAADYLEVAPEVVRIRPDVPVPTAFDPATPTVPRDPAALVELEATWDLGSALRRAESALFGEAITPRRDDPAEPG
jgi:5'-3' exonuclease